MKFGLKNSVDKEGFLDQDTTELHNSPVPMIWLHDPIPPLVEALLLCCRHLGHLPDHSDVVFMKKKWVMVVS